MKRKQFGFGLVELIVGLGIASIGILAFMRFSALTVGSEKKVIQMLSVKGEIKNFTRYISSAVSSGSLRFYGYTHVGEGEAVKHRLIVPLPRKCSDLSESENCKEDTALIYVKYNKTAAAGVTSICRFNQGASEYIVLDLNNSSYGKGELNDDVVKVTKDGIGVESISGSVSFKVDSQISFFDPPFAYVWLVKEKPERINVVQNQTTGVFPVTEFHPGCQARLQFKSGSTLLRKTDKIYKVKVEPFTLSKYLEGKNARPANTQAFTDSAFPLRTFNTQLEVIGRLEKDKKQFMGISRCVVKGDVLECVHRRGTEIENVSRLRIDEKFKVGMRDGFGEVKKRQIWYEALRAGMTSSCQTGETCLVQPLFFPNVDSVPILVNSNESTANLLNQNFSLVKQEELEIIRFRYTNQIKGKMDVIDAYVP